jgi:hypothetical protein
VSRCDTKDSRAGRLDLAPPLAEVCAGTPVREFTSAETSTFGGYSTVAPKSPQTFLKISAM